MGDEQERDGEPKRELPRFARRHAQMAPPIQRIKAEQSVGEE